MLEDPRGCMASLSADYYRRRSKADGTYEHARWLWLDGGHDRCPRKGVRGPRRAAACIPVSEARADLQAALLCGWARDLDVEHLDAIEEAVAVKLDLSTCACAKPSPRGPLPEMLQAGDFRGVCATCHHVIEPALVYP